MSDESFSPQAQAAFLRDHDQMPASLRRPGDVAWLRGYDTCRGDNAAAMQLMQDELADWRTGHRKLKPE